MHARQKKNFEGNMGYDTTPLFWFLFLGICILSVARLGLRRIQYLGVPSSHVLRVRVSDAISDFMIMFSFSKNRGNLVEEGKRLILKK